MKALMMKYKLLICPPNRPDLAIKIDEEQQKQIRHLAKYCGLVLNETDTKMFVGAHDYATPEAPVYKQSFLDTVANFQTQRDNDEWWRTCFTSSVTMVLLDYKPGCLGEGTNLDEEFLKFVEKYGDTTDPVAQCKALAEFGIKATRDTNGTMEDLYKRFANGEMVATGILHKGSPDAPRGGGHWVVPHKREGSRLVVNDPYGELDLVRGVYLHADGKDRRYSIKNFAKRWLADGPATGWFINVHSVDGVAIKR